MEYVNKYKKYRMHKQAKLNELETRLQELQIIIQRNDAEIEALKKEKAMLKSLLK